MRNPFLSDVCGLLSLKNLLPWQHDITIAFNREEKSLCSIFFWGGGVGVNKVHYGLCENGWSDLKVQAISNQETRRPQI